MAVELQDEAVLTNDNFNDFNWAALSTVTVQRCLKEVTSLMCKPSAATLATLKFENVSTTKNIKTLLASCVNLKKVSFAEVLIDEFRKKSAKLELLEHPNITHIIIKSSTSISKKERWLVDFLYGTFLFKKLKSLRIQKVFTDDANPEITFDFIEKYGQDIDEDVVSRFILRHRSTLKELEIGGPGLRISFPLQSTKDMEKFKSVQLESFIFSMDGSDLGGFLKYLNKLQTLNCSHIFKLDTRLDVWNLTSAILDCVVRNASTLTEIKMYPIFLADQSREKLMEDNILTMFTVNCKVFTECTALKKLVLGLHAYRKEEDLANPKLATLMGNRLTNIHFIPAQLTDLCLPVEEYSRDELELFANTLSRFQKLKSFYFGTSQLNPVNAYLIKFLWVKNLLALPDIERIEFHNGRLEDEEMTREYSLELSKTTGKQVKININFPRYTFTISRAGTTT